jgi:GrpB-like predicted nucleotidyltransferase (UPF0157 family)
MATLSNYAPIVEGIRAEKEAGRTHLIVQGTFTTPQQLRTLRVAASSYDDEIYAFRLPLSPLLLFHASKESRQDSLKSIHRKWVEALEAGARYGDMGYEILVESSEPGDTAALIWDDVHAPVELVTYQSSWPEIFEREKTCLLSALQNVIESGKIKAIEHIGSTAIQGMSAKPIIDMLITVHHLDDTVACIQPLRELGYAFIDYAQNTDRRFFRKGTPRSHHIHIVEHASPSALAYLRFRDILRANADLRQEYLSLKQESMQRFTHRRALYGEQKSALIRKVLAKT